MSGWLIGVVVLLVVVLLLAAAAGVLLLRRGGPAPRGTVTGRPGPSGAPDPGPEGTRRDLRPVGPVPPGRGPAPGGVLPRDLVSPGGGLTLLQLSSAFCRSCRDTRGVLSDVAAEHPGVVHRDVDVAVRPELVRLLGVRSTPTTLLVDPRGTELLRVVGVPRRAALVGALAPHLPRSDGAA